VSTLVALLRELPDAPRAPALTDAAWTQVLDQADRQGLAALLHHHLGGLVTPAVHERLKQANLVSQARALRLKRLLDFVLDGLAAQGIVPIVLKGIGLSSRYWREWHLRPSGDIDVLLEPERVEPAAQFLIAQGYAEHGDPGEDDPEAHHHHRSFTGRLGLVEVHFRALAGPGGGALEGPELFARARSATLGGRAVRYLAPEEELVFLASHAAQHLFQRLAWIYDLKLLMSAEAGLNFTRVAEIARQSRLAAGTHAALVLASTVLGAPVPREHLQAIAPTRAHAAAVLAAFSPERLAESTVALSRAAPMLRALLADSPDRAVKHLVEGTAQRIKRAVRSRVGGGDT
jgi:hypothetical protein